MAPYGMFKHTNTLIIPIKEFLNTGSTCQNVIGTRLFSFSQSVTDLIDLFVANRSYYCNFYSLLPLVIQDLHILRWKLYFKDQSFDVCLMLLVEFHY